MTAGEVEEEPVAFHPLDVVKQNREEDEEEEESVEDPRPVGDVIRVSGEGTESRKHYHSFAFDGNQYHLEDPVLLVPEEQNQKPKMAIIKKSEEFG
ncbi:protein REPRESSOR OF VERNALIZATION 1-like isoform X2 [Coffea arabica]|uniref:Protein REPRESSOR OF VERNALIZATION 1-like isoform X2 n=1 Tax=Coffea arabica TaxID=13443 RepID=A0ABM4UWK2_COFAR